MISPRIQRRPIVVAGSDWPDSVHPVLRRVYAARGVRAFAEVEHRLAAMLSPQALGGIERACELVEAAIRNKLRIVVVGDFDADGATGTAVAVRGLRLLGARKVGYAVPNRFRHGYGLSPPVVEELLVQQPGLLITVDNGIAAHAGVAAAKAHGMQVIVTDHHLAGETLPDADAIVNPNLVDIKMCAHASTACERCIQDARLNKDFPSKALAGVGVMFYLLLAVRTRLREHDWFSQSGIPEPDLASLLDLVALGTVADLVALDRNNRILVAAGLKRIRAGRACAGIVALIETGRRDPATLVASDLGFVVAPRINAAGRLQDMSLGIECLLTDDIARAHELAETLSAINSERRELQAGMVEQAQAEVHKWTLEHSRQSLTHGLVLFDPGWHHGVVGLVASKLKETLHRPVIACAPAGIGKCGDGSPLFDSRDKGDCKDNDEVKASGRSIAGFHLRDALAEIDVRHPGLLRRFGGHAMAAGLTLHRGDIEKFAAAFDAVARERLTPEILDAIVLTDGELEPADFSLDLATQLRYAGPWGQGFAEPLFDGVFEVESWRVVGEKHLRFVLRREGLAEPLEAILFNAYAGVPPPTHVHAVFGLDVNEWQGRYKLQLLLRHIEASG